MDTNIPAAKRCDADALIDELGGTVAVARLCEVTSQAVTQWRRTGIPRARLMYLRAVKPAAFAGREQSAQQQQAA
jgi:hypothetical protein